MDEINSSFERMKEIFDEREKEYQARDAELKKRRAYCQSLESQVIKEKNLLDAKEKELSERENLFAEKEKEFEAKGQELKEQEKYLSQCKEEMDKSRSEAYMKAKLMEEELKNEQMKMVRMQEELEYKKDMGGIADFSIDLTDYIPKTELSNYISKAELVNYVPKIELEKELQRSEKLVLEVDELKKQVEDLTKAKAELFRRMFGKPEADVTTAGVENKSVEEISDKEKIKEEIPKEVPLNKVEEAVIERTYLQEKATEASRDLTAEGLFESLSEDPNKFTNVKVLHSETGDLVRAVNNEYTLHFLFDEPPRFDVITPKKETRKLKEHLEELERENPEVTFRYEDGEVTATGFFLRTMETQTLLQHVEKIAACLEE